MSDTYARSLQSPGMDAYSEAARIVAAYQGGPLDTTDAARIVECCGRLLDQRERARVVLDQMPGDWAKVRAALNELGRIVNHDSPGNATAAAAAAGSAPRRPGR